MTFESISSKTGAVVIGKRMILNNLIRSPSRFFCNKKLKLLSFDSLTPIVVVPLLMVLSSFGFLLTSIVFSILPLLVGHLHILATNRQSESKFFVMWIIVSLFCIFVCLEFLVVPLMVISHWENITFYVLLVLVLVKFRTIKRNAVKMMINGKRAGVSSMSTKEHYCSICSERVSDRYGHCPICHACIFERSHHSMWINCCISRANRKEFIILHLFLLFWLLYTSYLILTTVCLSSLKYNAILVPNDCSSVYSEFRSSLSFSAAVYCTEIAVVAFVSVMREYISLFSRV